MCVYSLHTLLSLLLFDVLIIMTRKAFICISLLIYESSFWVDGAPIVREKYVQVHSSIKLFTKAI